MFGFLLHFFMKALIWRISANNFWGIWKYIFWSNWHLFHVVCSDFCLCWHCINISRPLHSLDTTFATNSILLTTVATDTGKIKIMLTYFIHRCWRTFVIVPLPALSPLLLTDYFYYDFKCYLYCTYY